MNHFNGLKPAEAELLAVLAEECGELVQAIGKILRHGLYSVHPDTRVLNRTSLEREMGDVRAAMIMLCAAYITDKDRIHDWGLGKLERIKPYLHHQKIKCDGNHGGPRCADPGCWNQ